MAILKWRELVAFFVAGRSNRPLCRGQGRALRNCPVGNFSEGASLQGWRLKLSFGFAELAKSFNAKVMHLFLLGSGGFSLLTFFCRQKKVNSNRKRFFLHL
jgi:hypothetical protein